MGRIRTQNRTLSGAGPGIVFLDANYGELNLITSDTTINDNYEVVLSEITIDAVLTVDGKLTLIG